MTNFILLTPGHTCDLPDVTVKDVGHGGIIALSECGHAWRKTESQDRLRWERCQERDICPDCGTYLSPPLPDGAASLRGTAVRPKHRYGCPRTVEEKD